MNSSVSNTTTASPLSEWEKLTRLHAFLTLSREERHAVPLATFLAHMLTWLPILSMDYSSDGSSLEEKLAWLAERSNDELYNLISRRAFEEVRNVRRNKQDKLSRFATIVVEYLLDREYFPEVWPMDSETLSKFTPSYMYRGRVYSYHEYHSIYTSRVAELTSFLQQRLVNVAQARGIVVTETLLGKIEASVQACIREFRITIEDALEHHVMMASG